MPFKRSSVRKVIMVVIVPDRNHYLKLCHKFLFGAGGGSRTHMIFRSRAFEARASAIPPLRLKLNYISF